MGRGDLAARVQAVLDELRPALRSEGVDVELVEVDASGVARLAVRALDVACPVDLRTFRSELRRRLQRRVPEVTAVRATTEGSDEEYDL